MGSRNQDLGVMTTKEYMDIHLFTISQGVRTLALDMDPADSLRSTYKGRLTCAGWAGTGQVPKHSGSTSALS
jgi:hypothetical protein